MQRRVASEKLLKIKSRDLRFGYSMINAAELSAVPSVLQLARLSGLSRGVARFGVRRSAKGRIRRGELDGAFAVACAPITQRTL